MASNKKKFKQLYDKVKAIQLDHKITGVAISNKTGLSKQTVSNRISSIEKSGIVYLDVIYAIEEMSGEKIL